MYLREIEKVSENKISAVQKPRDTFPLRLGRIEWERFASGTNSHPPLRANHNLFNSRGGEVGGGERGGGHKPINPVWTVKCWEHVSNLHHTVCWAWHLKESMQDKLCWLIYIKCYGMYILYRSIVRIDAKLKSKTRIKKIVFSCLVRFLAQLVV